MLDECVHSLDEPFRRSEILGWFRRHYPEVNEGSIGPHIQGATSNAPGGVADDHPPLLTRVSHGVYRRYAANDSATGAERNPAATRPVVATSHITEDASEAEPSAQPMQVLGEKAVQSRVVAYLVRAGWSITSVADTASKERGIDIVATRNNMNLGVEVKGYPGRNYSDARRAGEKKPTQPSLQATHYFSGAILSAMRQKSRLPEMLSVVALPDVPRYRTLANEVAGSLAAARIGLWLIDEEGIVDEIVVIGDESLSV